EAALDFERAGRASDFQYNAGMLLPFLGVGKMKLRAFALIVSVSSFLAAPWNCVALSAPNRAKELTDNASSQPADTLTLSESTGQRQVDRPVTVARAFRQGEIHGFAQASIGGTPLFTQCDVKNRWPDGSLKYALVSFVIGKLAGKRTIEVS